MEEPPRIRGRIRNQKPFDSTEFFGSSSRSFKRNEKFNPKKFSFFTDDQQFGLESPKKDVSKTTVNSIDYFPRFRFKKPICFMKKSRSMMIQENSVFLLLRDPRQREMTSTTKSRLYM